MLDMSLDELNKSNDPFIKLARKIFDENMELEKFNKARSSSLQKNKSIYISQPTFVDELADELQGVGRVFFFLLSDLLSFYD